MVVVVAVSAQSHKAEGPSSRLALQINAREPIPAEMVDRMSPDERAQAVDARIVDGARLAEVCARFGVAELSVFGSVARGTAGSESDIDLLYVIAPGRSLGFAVHRLEDELSDLFGRKVDLVSKRALHQLLRDRVLAEAQTLYAA